VEVTSSVGLLMLLLSGAAPATASADGAEHGAPGTVRIWTEPARRVVGEGERFETEYFVYDGVEPGPTVLIEAGIHGNEPAGTWALDRLHHTLIVTRGRVILFPRMNRRPLAKGKRFLDADLNKQFPGRAKSKVYEQRLAAAIYEMVGREKPDLVITLHEARKNIWRDKQCCAHTIIYGIDEPTTGLKDTIRRINEAAHDEMHRFQLYHYPIPTSSSEIFVRDFGLEAYCVETWLRDPKEDRVRSHLNVVRGFLDAYGIGYHIDD